MRKGSIKVFDSTGRELCWVDYVTARIWIRLNYVVIKEGDPALRFPRSLMVKKDSDEVVYALLRKKYKRRNPND